MTSNLFDLTLEKYESNPSACNSLVEQFTHWSQLPTINQISLDTFREGSLARFEGMIQDVLNTEYFFGKYKIKDSKTNAIVERTGRFRDVLPYQDIDEIIIEEFGKDQDVRQPLFCIPIPGVNEWAKDFIMSNNKMPVSCNTSGSGLKRPLDEENEMEVEEESTKRRQDTAHLSSYADNSSYTNDKYFPLPGETRLPCLVKYYGDRDDFLVNTRIEAIGFLSLSPALEASWQNSDEEDIAVHPPPSLVPRLHALKIRKLTHSNPMLLSEISTTELDAQAILSDLKTTLTPLLFGDVDAADYLICNLLASVYARRDGLSLGAFCLNLFNIPVPGFAVKLYDFLKILVPCSTYLPLSIDLLNTTPFVPRKDYDSNRLWSGRLQLADDTLVFVDETVMGAGMLNATGLKNVAALHSLAQRQELRYDFTYFQLDFHTNLPLIIASEGKSMIPTDAPIKIKVETDTVPSIDDTFEAAKFFMSGSRLEGVRRYLSTMRMRHCDMTNTEFVGPSWVELRQEDKSLKQDDLHRLLVLARVLAVREGRTALTPPNWNQAVAMEKSRKARMNN